MVYVPTTAGEKLVVDVAGVPDEKYSVRLRSESPAGRTILTAVLSSVQYASKLHA